MHVRMAREGCSHDNPGCCDAGKVSAERTRVSRESSSACRQACGPARLDAGGFGGCALFLRCSFWTQWLALATTIARRFASLVRIHLCVTRWGILLLRLASWRAEQGL